MKFAAVLLLTAACAPATAFATGLATCDSGPESGWQSQEKLTKMLTDKGWTVRRIKIDDGCYEIDAKDGDGKNIEATIHPATLEVLKLEHEQPEKAEEED